MPLRFTITDYSAGTSGTDISIDEPIGMDSIGLHISRDANYHGFMDAVDDSLGSLRFTGTGYTTLKDAYAAYGQDAYLTLLIEFACSDTDAYATLYEGRFDFFSYREVQGADGCYVECGVVNGYWLSVFKSRADTQLSLDETRPFDADRGYSALSPYTALGRPVELHPMTIRMINLATVDTEGPGSNTYKLPSPNNTCPTFADTDGTDNPDNNEFNLFDAGAHVIVPTTNIRNAEFGDFPGGVGDRYNDQIYQLGSANELFTYKPDVPYDSNIVRVEIQLNMAIIAGDPNHSPVRPRVEFSLRKALTWADARDATIFYDFSYPTPGTGTKAGSSDRYYNLSACGLDYVKYPTDSIGGAILDGIATTLNYSFGAGNVFDPGAVAQTQYFFDKQVLFNPGEKLYFLVQVLSDNDGHGYGNPQTVFFSGDYTYRNSYFDNSGNPVTLTKQFNAPLNSPISFIKLTFDSRYQQTKSQVYMINEALARAVELTTNNEMTVYSDYFGRTDAQPYGSVADGPGAYTGLANGLMIRGYTPLVAFYMGAGQFILNSPPSFSTYQLQATDNVPMPGHKLIQISYPTDNIVYIPDDTTYNFPIGYQCIVEQGGTGIITIAPLNSNVTVSSSNGKFTSANLENNAGLLAGQTYNSSPQILLTKLADNSWLVSSQPTMFTSFRDMMEAMHCIHAVGFGDEDDPHRPGHKLIRVEPIRYFYNDTVLMTCDNVDTIECTINNKDFVSTFKTGYQKWEAEEAQGLDEFLTTRSFKTTLLNIKSTIEKVCKFVASGYAIEVTRRKLGTNTTDWRFDKDTFVISLMPDGSGGYKSESGNVSNGTNMVDPSTVYNYRISPVRNALRWLWMLVQSYVNPSAGKLIFNEGAGNYSSSGELSTAPIENRILRENDTLSLSDYADSTISPLYRNELIKFKYPLSYAQWVTIFANKYGLIGYSVNGGATEYGWIEDLKYNLYEGIAEFTLKPKIS